MKVRNIIITLLALSAVFAVSCKKDDETTDTKPSLSGLYFNVIPYLRAGQQVKVTPTRPTHPDGKEIGYYWQIDDKKRDTVKTELQTGIDISKTFSFTKFEEGAHTISCTAYAEGYYSSTCSVTVTVVNPAFGKTVTVPNLSEEDPSIVDNRNTPASENRYYYLHIGALDWMRNNMAYTASGVAYMDSEVTSYPLGRYYTWEEAQTACPSGWRLPTYAEWETLGNVAGDLMADASLLGEKMWEFWPQVKITDAYYFAAIPAGYAMVGSSRNAFAGFLDYAMFWTADTSDTEATQARYVYLHEKEAGVMSGYGDKSSLALSVRCVR